VGPRRARSSELTASEIVSGRSALCVDELPFTLPVFLRANLHMSAQQTGIVLLPGAIATAISMGVVGRLSNKIDPRLMITGGAILFAMAAWSLSKITSASGAHDFFWPLIGRGLGLGMMFVPLTTITLAQLSPRELPQGVGLYSFFRQLGGSFGIAAIATLVVRYTSQYRDILGDHLSMNDPLALGRIDMLTRGMIARGSDAAAAHQRALSLLNQELLGQASVIAYSKIYVLAAGLILLLIPLLLLVRETKAPAGDHAIIE
jgi:MFS transporter, DHA2 family, multidrug resistance protein